jgi:membrane protease YdiL (CAAX protease family)
VAPAILILGIINTDRVRSWSELFTALRRVIPIWMVTVAIVIMLTMAMGYVRFEPKWTSLFLVWAVVNLFFTCLSEEAFFRGFLQHELARIGSNPTRAAIVAIGVSALLFGLAHFGGGWRYVIAGVIAGVGYGLAYHLTKRVEASMAVHFALNAMHFLLFTYPALA